MPIVPIDLQAGFYRNGTDLEGSNRWRDGSLVRWLDGSMRPIGGWEARKNGFSEHPIRGMHSWQSNNGTAWLAGGSYNELKVMTGAGVAYNITPDDLATGRESAAVNTGYGFGYYGQDYYGNPRPVNSDTIPQEASVWQLDNFGQNLIAHHSDDGRLFEWSLSTTQGSNLINNGNFAADAAWNKGDGWSISQGKAKWATYSPSFNPSNMSSYNSIGDEIEFVEADGQTLLTTHEFDDGDAVIYRVPAGSEPVPELTPNQTYYIIKGFLQGNNEVQLEASVGGGAINFAYPPNWQINGGSGLFDTVNDTIEMPTTVGPQSFVNGFRFYYSVHNSAVAVGGLTPGNSYYVINRDNAANTIQVSNDYTANTTPTLSNASPIVVTVVNVMGANKYYFDGVEAPAITLLRGQNYIFDVSDSSNTNHPLQFRDASGVPTIAYQVSGTAGQAGATVTLPITVSGGNTRVAEYLCQTHGTSMGNSVSVVSPFGTPIDITTDGTSTGFHRFIKSHVVGGFHQLELQSFGNLDQTFGSLVATPDDQDSHDVTITLDDPNTDNNVAAKPSVKLKISGLTTTTVFVDEFLNVGENTFRFGPDDTAAKIEIIPQALNTPEFYVDNILLRQKTVIEPIANAPINNKGMVVTEERFIFALGSGGNSRKISWCDKENNTVWNPLATNEAGDIELATAGQIMQGIRSRGVTLILTDTDAHVAQYIAPPYVYSFQRIGTHCGAVSRLSAVAVDRGVFWYGQENFHYFDGNTVQTLKCDVHDYVFGDFNKDQQSKVWGMSVGTEDEIWWFYCSSSSQEIDRYVAYDSKEGHWLIGNLSRTSGVSRGVFANPFMSGELAETITINVTVVNDSGNKYQLNLYSGSAPQIELVKGKTYIFDQSHSSNSGHPLRFSSTPDGTHSYGVEYLEGVTVVGTAGQAGAYTQIVVGNYAPTLYYYCVNHGMMGAMATVADQVTIYNHEYGNNYDGNTIFCETGPIQIGTGEKIAKVTNLIPDEKTQGDVNLKFKTRFHPNDVERTFPTTGSYNPNNPTSVRFSGRQLRMRVEGNNNVDWRVGVMRLDVKAGGKR
tara:strand:- start:2354 stop:5551 length:3198 start_codon:yes stop_codon:yes gene_type:complete